MLNVLFIAVVGYLTFRILFNNKEISEVMCELHRADKLWLILGCVCTFCFIAGESVIIKYMLSLFKEKIPFRRCLKYSFIGFFYSYITPSSSGGQPAQMIYMKKDGIYYGYSSLIMLVIAVVYKAVLVLLGIFFYIFYHDFVTQHVGGYMWLVYVGFFLNLAYITLLLIVCLKPLWSRKMAIKLINFLTRLHVLNKKNTEGYIKRVTRIFDNYVKASKYIGSNMGSLFTITWITVLQRLSLFMLTWIGLFSSCIAECYGTHVRVSVIDNAFPPIVLRIFGIIRYFLKLAFFTLFTYYACRIFSTTRQRFGALPLSYKWQVLPAICTGIFSLIFLILRTREIFTDKHEHDVEKDLEMLKDG